MESLLALNHELVSPRLPLLWPFAWRCASVSASAADGAAAAERKQGKKAAPKQERKGVAAMEVPLAASLFLNDWPTYMQPCVARGRRFGSCRCRCFIVGVVCGRGLPHAAHRSGHL